MTIGPRVTQPPAGMPGAGLVGEAGGERSAGGFGDSVRVTVSPSGGVGDALAVDAAVEGDLRRDDEIGMLFARPFSLPAPDMPESLSGESRNIS